MWCCDVDVGVMDVFVDVGDFDGVGVWFGVCGVLCGGGMDDDVFVWDF